MSEPATAAGAVRPVDRPEYIAALQAHQAGQGSQAFDQLLLGCLEAALDESLAAIRDALPPDAS